MLPCLDTIFVNANKIQRALADCALVRRIYYFDEIGSTSDYAARLVADGHGVGLDGTLVVAKHQTSGRGRMNRTWSAPPGKGLLFSLILDEGRFQNLQGVEPGQFLSYAIPVAVCEALRTYTAEVSIKFPNDMVVAGRKIGGILLEQKSMGGRKVFVAGIGLNINQAADELPPDARMPATSLLLETGIEADMGNVLKNVADSIRRCLYDGPPEAIAYRLSRMCDTLGRGVSIDMADEVVTGTAESIGSDGALVIRTDYGVRRVQSGEVKRLSMVPR
jgi:BirA family biotin operon repressor/biotin-[acetyl-CoA-carboxylase] ligase